MPVQTLSPGEIPLSSDNVHATWSEFTKKKNVRAELTRLENISWRIWHSLRTGGMSSRRHGSAPRFAVHVDAATACIVDPMATPLARSQASVPSLHLFAPPGQIQHHENSQERPSWAPPTPPSSQPAPASDVGAQSPSSFHLQVARRPHIRKASFSHHPSAAKALSPPSHAHQESSAPNSAQQQPYIVITLPTSLLAPHPRALRRHFNGTPPRSSGAASPDALIKRTDRQVDLSRYFAFQATTQAAMRILTYPISSPDSSDCECNSSSSGPRPPVVFLIGGSSSSSACDEAEALDDSSDEDDFDDINLKRISYAGTTRRMNSVSLEEMRTLSAP